jgi:hypothetical protein
VKWRAGEYSVESFRENLLVSELKESLFQLTSVDPTHQKLLYKGKLLRNDDLVESLGLKNVVILPAILLNIRMIS